MRIRSRGIRRAVIWFVALSFCVPVALMSGQSGDLSTGHTQTGEQIFKSACAACHGADGRGTPQEIAGFTKPRTFPDFTQCDQTTPEASTAWKDVILHGGPTRGFSDIMPSFSEALTSEQIDDVIANLPRALVTEKAYPEDEVVISTSFNAQGAPGGTTHIIHEQRFGMKNQIEVDVPINYQDLSHTWYGGVGDTTLGVKRVIYSSLPSGSIERSSGSILSLFGGAILPTGNRARGFGTGTTTFETFAAFDQLFKTNTFIQTQFGADLPRHTNIAPQSIFFNTAIGQSFAANHGLGRLWSPMFEFVGARDLVDNAKMNWDVVPQMQVTISRRQHVRANLGVRVPVNNTAGRQIQVVFYVLWDWFDGRLNEGW